MTEESEKRNELAWKIFLWALGILVSIVLSVTVGLWRMQGDLNDRLISIESNRCSAIDCSSIRGSVSNLQERLSSLSQNTPPRWFLEKVNTLEQRIAKLEGITLANKERNKQKSN